jgi:glutamate-ammonia-ligase adenylyltransferase
MSTDTSGASAMLAELAEQSPRGAALLQAATPELRAAAARVVVASDFVVGALRGDVSLLPQLLGGATASALALPAPVAADEQLFTSALRRWRRSELARIAWRDLAGWAPLPETLAALSEAADQAIRAACAAATGVLTARHGVPRSANGTAQELVVVAMGKLGGGELNFSSDVDLIFLFPEQGDTDGARSISNEEYFTRLGQLLIRYLDQRTADGFVYRVDMRLRPFGESGPLVASFASLEDYLERHGRDWERYAWVKARAVTGESFFEELFRNAVRPFVYRRYLDFGVFESLREMKALIEREVARRELHDNIKLGPGGIREIEFVVQAFQLVRGGQDRRLQCTSLLRTLPNLVGSKLLPAQAADELGEAYAFLRVLENRLQMIGDQQTHMLPIDPATRTRLAQAMGYAEWKQLESRLDAHRQRVAEHFAALVADAGGNAAPVAGELGPLWDGAADRAGTAARLAAMGIGATPESADQAAQLLLDLGQSALLRRLDDNGRRRLTALLPALLADIARQQDPVAVLRRVLKLLEAIGPRSAYFSLLHANGSARARLVQLAGHGSFLVEQLAAHPLLLDELIDTRLFELLPERAAMQADLAQRMAEVTDDDEERQVEQLRHFQRAAVFRIAVADLTGRLPVMSVSDRLTDVAELIIEQAMQLTWRHLGRKLGTPACGSGAERRAVQICAVGYGKLGGWELGYTSDLDLVFLHDSVGADQHTDGERTLDNQMFFVRFVQRLVHLLSMHSAAGRLYEVDMRLRPSGKGGMLITNIEAFRDYQQHEAWTWEHQALLHARAVAGAEPLRARFEALRIELLQRCVRRDQLQTDVRQMRERMRAELAQSDPTRFDLKKDIGGLADIEFLAQYWALRWADRYPPVAMFPDTIRQLESVASADLVPQTTIDVLVRAYRVYRERIHHRSLQGLDAVVPVAELAAERAAVTAVWNAAMQV